MSTGYTNDIKKGISFEEFAITCARAFGACVSLKDNSLDTPIPKKFEPSKYHLKQIEEIKKQIIILNKMNIKIANKKANDEYLKEIKRCDDMVIDNTNLLQKYQEMLKKVIAWKPPTKNHFELKEFMKKQIDDSIDFDCDISYYENKKNKINKLNGEQWKEEQLKLLNSNLKYHTEEYKKEVERAKNNTKWIVQLRKSLK